ncbi:unnamed protein product [Timema podura]|uniref:Protein hook n=1 Tax=Timema podura TaxID=61482 RepID=A0ABN7NE46_TIMPD|nr:unnamed protein product [Timema podura]
MEWLQTFDVEAPHQTLDALSDGVAMAQVLNQIAPEWFTKSWMSKIKSDVGTNWRLKVSNLRKIVEGIVDYYQDGLNQHFQDFSKPDVNKIGEKCDAAEMGRLLQLILGCAINCNHNQDYIAQIRAMEESVQQVIMQAIQELEQISHYPNSSSIIIDQRLDYQKLVSELEAATEARNQMAQRCHELDMQVSLLQEEKTIFSMENKKLVARMQEFETIDDLSAGAGHRYKEMRKQNDTLKEEMFKIETSRDDYRLKVEIQEKEILELQSKLEDLQKTADEARHLKDEVDILRETAEKVVQYEATITSYKKKLEESGDLKRQVKILEDKNTYYMQQNLELEEEIKKSGSWKPQLEMYRKQNMELHQKLNEEKKRADKIEFESKKLLEKLDSLQIEKERLTVERDMLKETNEELKCFQLQQRSKTSITQNASIALLDETGPENMIPPEVKEKLVRLQHENKLLKLNQRGPEVDKLPVVQALLDDTTQQVNQLQLENQLANQRVLELESQIEELNETGDAGMKHRLSELQNQLRVVQTEKDLKITQLEERDASIAEYKQKLIVMQESLRRSEQEVVALEERYKRYIEKAKSVIKNLDPKQNPSSFAEVNVLRSQLLEKHKVIEDLEEEKEQNKLCRDMEEKLMTTAFYKLGMVRHRDSVDHRLAVLGSNQGQSFLTRQRQATIRRSINNFESR